MNMLDWNIPQSNYKWLFTAWTMLNHQQVTLSSEPPLIYHCRCHQFISHSVLSHCLHLPGWIFSRTTKDRQTLKQTRWVSLHSIIIILTLKIFWSLKQQVNDRHLPQSNLHFFSHNIQIKAKNWSHPKRLDEMSSLNTDLSEGPCSQTHLSSCPQWHHQKRGECHGPTKCICPVRVNVPVVNPEVCVSNQVQDKRNLWTCEEYN